MRHVFAFAQIKLGIFPYLGGHKQLPARVIRRAPRAGGVDVDRGRIRSCSCSLIQAFQRSCDAVSTRKASKLIQWNLRTFDARDVVGGSHVDNDVRFGSLLLDD